MTTIADLCVTAPTPGHGYPIQIPGWRFVVEIADPSAGSSIVWHDLTAYYAGDTADRGANEYMGRYTASVVAVTLQAEDDRLAPWGQDTSALFGVNVPIDAGLIMRAALSEVVGGVTTDWLPVWLGRVETWGDASYARGRFRRHQVTVVDTIGDLVNVPIPEMGFADPWDERIGGSFGILHFADFPFGWDVYGDTGAPAMQESRPEQASAISELDATADPVGIAWRSRRTGRLIFHPAPWDTTHATRWDNPLLDIYPDGLVFSYTPQTGEIAYVAGTTDREPFGVERTTRGIVNGITVTSPAGVYAIDDPTSYKYGRKPIALSWQIPNDAVADDLLAARAHASAQALPLQTTIDHEGFWPAMAMIDHLDPVTVIYTTGRGLIVTAPGTVRGVNERRVRRGRYGISWTSMVQIDLTSTTAVESLNPVENLHIISENANYVTAGWTNPAQTITPTDTQIRIIGLSNIWIDWPYPITVWDSGPLGLDTQYRLEVRLVRKVDGLVLNASPSRSVTFTTHKAIEIGPGDGGGTGVDTGPVDPECEMEWKLDESANGVDGWTTVESGDQDDPNVTDNGDGTFHIEFDPDIFDTDLMYRLCQREVCDGTPGAWECSGAWDPPDDWEDPCGTPPPALSTPPFDDPDLLVYVPRICAPDIVREAVSMIAGVKGSGWGGILQNQGDPNQLAIGSNATGGIIAYGECPQIAGHTGSKSLICRTKIADAAAARLVAECAAIRISTVNVSATTFRFTTTLYKPGATITIPSDIHDEGYPYYVAVTYDAETGETILYVNGIAENTHDGGDDSPTINAMPIWSVGGPPNSWITDVALFDRVLDPSELPTPLIPQVTINQAAGQTDPTAVSPILFDVVFSEPVTLFTSADITISGTAGATTAVPSGVVGGATYTVAVTGMTSNGTVIVDIPAGVVVSVDTGTPNAASTSTDNQVSWTGSVPPLDTAILALNPLSYWKLRGNDANTLKDYGTLATPNLANSSITLNSTAGEDGFSYPRKTGAVAGAVLTGSDNAAYTPAAAPGGLTIFYLYRPFGASGQVNVIVKNDASGNGEWNLQHNDGGGTVTASTSGTSGAARSRTTGNVIAPSAWNLVVARISSAGPQTIRNNRLNCGGTEAGVLAFRGDTAVTVKLFGHGGTVGPSNCSLAHVAIFNGQLTDAQIETLENSAKNDGWTLGLGANFTGGTTTTPGDGYRYHKFTANGTLTCVTPGLIEMWAQGAGGGGGIATTNGPGGGGAGGRHLLASIVSANQTITIGTGGVATPATGVFAVAGGNTTIGSLATGNGGGGGGTRSSWRNGAAGGCGGGGGDSSGGGAIGSQGGNGGAGSSGALGGGGGGGIGGNGQSYSAAPPNTGGLGGAGISDWSGGQIIGQGGAGRGATTQPTQTPQTANTGNGGNAHTTGQNGQDGVAWIRYRV